MHYNDYNGSTAMKRFLMAVAATTVALQALAEVGVSVSIGQPGFYGRIDIGDYPQPRLLYPQPLIIEHGSDRGPVYLRVPPGHAKHWSKHCHEYRACGERVFFVQDDWYEREYVPRYQQKHGGGRHDDHDDKHDNHKGGPDHKHGHDK
jgi:hypothetical protein